MDDVTNATGVADIDNHFAWKIQFAGQFRAAFAIVTVVVGSIGNLLSFLVMRTSSMKSTSPGIYFAAIAIADTGTLLTGQIPSLAFHFHGFDIPSSHEWACRWFFFLLFTWADLAVWLMLAVTVDRFIAVCVPLKRKDLCTPERSLIACLCLAGGAIVKNVHLFWTRGAQVLEEPDGTLVTIQCGWPRKDYEYFGKYIRPWIAFTLYAFIPIGSLVVLNTAIAVAVWRYSKAKPGVSQHVQGQENDAQQQKKAAERRKVMQLTGMLLTVSVIFLVLITPSITVLIAKPYVAVTEEELADYAILEAIVDTLAYVNHSSNFFLYCLSGSGFRKEARRLLCRGQCMSKVDPGTTMDNTNASMA